MILFIFALHAAYKVNKVVANEREFQGVTRRSLIPDYRVSVLAGSGDQGFQDGGIGESKLNSPRGITINNHGVTFVVDSGNHAIRKITRDGNVTTIAGDGTAGFIDADTGQKGRLNSPSGIAIDRKGNLYVADTGNHAIRKITPAGKLITIAGNGTAGFIDGEGTQARLHSPSAITLDVNDHLYVADTGNNAIRKILSAGKVETLVQNKGMIFFQEDFSSASWWSPSPDSKINFSNGTLNFDEAVIGVPMHTNYRFIVPYTIEVDFRIGQGKQKVAFLTKISRAGDRTAIVLEKSQIQFQLYRDGRYQDARVIGQYKGGGNKWHRLKLKVYQDSQEVIIDHQFIGSIETPERNRNEFNMFQIGFETFNTELSADNLKIYPIEPHEIISQPEGVAIDFRGDLYLSSAGLNPLLIYDQRCSPCALTGTGSKDVFGFDITPELAVIDAASSGRYSSALSDQQFLNKPTTLFYNFPYIYVADTGNNRIRKYHVLYRNLTTVPVYNKFDEEIGGTYLDSEGIIFSKPAGVAAISYEKDFLSEKDAHFSHVYVADTENNRVLRFIDFRGIKGPFSPDPILGFYPGRSRLVVLQGEMTYMATMNSAGLRDYEYPLNKPVNTYRIVMLGDSYTYGCCVPIQDTYPQLLEDRLNEYGLRHHLKTRFEVINAGVGGYSTLHSFLILKTIALEYQPDLVIYNFDKSDFGENFYFYQIANFDENGEPLNFFDQDEKAQTAGPFGANFTWDQAMEVTKKYTQQISDLCRRNGVEFVLLAFARNYEVSRSEAFLHHQYDPVGEPLYQSKLLDDLSKTQGISVMDLVKDFKTEGISYFPVFMKFDTHWGPNGHKLMADLVFANLIKKGYVH